MPPRSHEEIMDALKAVERTNPERFKLFYDKVYLLLESIPPGESIEVAMYCMPKSMDLFYDIAELYMIEEREHKEPEEGLLYFSDDRKSIIRSRSLIRNNFYVKRSFKW